MAPFIPRQRKHKKIQKNHKNLPAGDNLDSNVIEILPPATAENVARKKAIKDELQIEHSAMSSGKRKRLDKYIVSQPPRAYALLRDRQSINKIVGQEIEKTRES